MVVINNNWLQCLKWLRLHNLVHFIVQEGSVEVMKYVTPLETVVLINRPIEGLKYDHKRIKEIIKAQPNTIEEKLIGANNRLIEVYSAILFKNGLNPDMSDASEESKEFPDFVQGDGLGQWNVK